MLPSGLVIPAVSASVSAGPASIKGPSVSSEAVVFAGQDGGAKQPATAPAFRVHAPGESPALVEIDQLFADEWSPWR
jgi:hypothetical protein